MFNTMSEGSRGVRRILHKRNVRTLKRQPGPNDVAWLAGAQGSNASSKTLTVLPQMASEGKPILRESMRARCKSFRVNPGAARTRSEKKGSATRRTSFIDSTLGARASANGLSRCNPCDSTLNGTSEVVHMFWIFSKSRMSAAS